MERKIESEIYFHSEDVDFQLESEIQYIYWLVDIAEKEKVTIEKITYIFCSDEFLLDINKTYLNHDYYTDIITFPYKQGNIVESDIFISIDRVKDNAHDNQVNFKEELHRVMAHGLLHLIGYGDKTTTESQIMRSKENECILLYPKV